MSKTAKLSLALALILVFALGAVAFAQTSTPEAQTAAGTGTPMAQVTPAITVRDQAVKDSTILIQQVVAAQDGWVVINNDNNGTAGTVIGHAPVKAGTTNDLVVRIDQAAATPRLFAVLHVDAGTTGTFEWPGPDAPVQLPSGGFVSVPFTVTGLTTAVASPTAAGAAGAPAAQTTPAATAAITSTATTAPTAAPTVATAAATATTAPTATPAPTVTPLAATATAPAPAAAAPAATASPTVSPSTLPTTGGSGGSTLVLLLLGVGGISLLAGLGLNLMRRAH